MATFSRITGLTIRSTGNALSRGLITTRIRSRRIKTQDTKAPNNSELSALGAELETAPKETSFFQVRSNLVVTCANWRKNRNFALKFPDTIFRTPFAREMRISYNWRHYRITILSYRTQNWMYPPPHPESKRHKRSGRFSQTRCTGILNIKADCGDCRHASNCKTLSKWILRPQAFTATARQVHPPT